MEEESSANDALIIEMLSKKEWQRCPRCGILTEKISGCNYIDCTAVLLDNVSRCGCQWCWICGKIKGNDPNETCIWKHLEHNSH